MNGKTPVSALQELMAARNQPLPTYIDEPFGLQFKCTVYVAGITASGTGPTKKSAKHKSAEKALEELTFLEKRSKLLLVKESSPPFQKLVKNYIGELNELSSKHGIPYPAYNFITSTVSGEFVWECKFMDRTVEGIGPNKKDGKQDAARRMLKTIEETDPTKYKIVTIRHTPSIESVEKEKVIAMFQTLSFTNEMGNQSLNNNNNNNEMKATPEIKIESNSVEELNAQLKKYGIEYSINEIQNKPSCVVSLVVKNSNLTFLGKGDTKHEALKDALQNILEVKKSGCSITTDLIEFS